MNKIMIVILVSAILLACKSSETQAQEVEVGDIIFGEATTSIVGKDFLMNELSYNITTLHIHIAGKNMGTGNDESEALSTTKKLEELTKTDIIETLTISENKQEALAKYLSDSYQQLQK